MSARRIVTVAAGAALIFLAAPGVAAADPIFDPADAQELSDLLAEASEGQQGVCYGWNVTIDDQYAGIDTGSSMGSNFGPNLDVNDAPGATSCRTTVEFTASITYTSEASESEDYASYSVDSAPKGPTTEDLDDLEIVDEDGLVGDSVDMLVYKAVSALPQLASDTGVARALEATPAPENAAGSSRLTDSPGSDFWRRSGNFLLWGSLLILAGIAFAIYAVRSSKRSGRGSRPRPASVGPVPEHIPAEWSREQRSWEQEYPSPQSPPSQYPPPRYPPPQSPPQQDPPPQPPPYQPPQDPGAKE